jgi:anti-sigma factor RsiW
MNSALSATEEELHAWLDGELPPERLAAVEARLAAHPEDAARLEAYRADGEAIARLFAHAGEAAIRTAAGRPALRPWSVGLAVAASLLIGFLGAALLFARGGPEKDEIAELMDEAVEYHSVYSAETKHLVEVPASEGGELVAWLSDRLGRQLTIPDLSADGLTFAGGRMLVVNRRPVAQLLYTRAEGRPVAVCVTRLAGPAEPLAVEERDGLRLGLWTAGGYGYVVIGELPEDRVRAISGRVAASLRG